MAEDSDRLAVLRRQRQLLTEHLAWLDREIAAAEDASASSLYPNFPPPGALATPDLPLASDPLPETLDPRAVHDNVRRGCFLYFALALLTLIAALAAFYFLYHR